MNATSELVGKVNEFRELCVSFATGTKVEYETYENARNDLLSEPMIQAIVPDWLIRNRWGSQYWSFIKEKSPNYEGRRKFLNDEFADIIDAVENDKTQPVSISISGLFEGLESPDIEKVWKKIHLRKENDIDGAITASRSLIESTLKYILDKEGIEYSSKDDLFDLYHKTAKVLNLSPKGHNEKLFKQILSGVTSIVQGFAELRNNYGDAHGKGEISYEAEARHSELAINLAGSMCSFLIQSYRFKLSGIVKQS